jgi:hypothetical protein
VHAPRVPETSTYHGSETRSDLPVLLRIESGGHLTGSLDQTVEETSLTQATVFDQLRIDYRNAL